MFHVQSSIELLYAINHLLLLFVAVTAQVWIRTYRRDSTRRRSLRSSRSFKATNVSRGPQSKVRIRLPISLFQLHVLSLRFVNRNLLHEYGYGSVNNTNLHSLSHTVFQLLRSGDQIIAKRMPFVNALVRNLCEYTVISHKLKTAFFVLHFCCNYFDVICPIPNWVK